MRLFFSLVVFSLGASPLSGDIKLKKDFEPRTFVLPMAIVVEIDLVDGPEPYILDTGTTTTIRFDDMPNKQLIFKDTRTSYVARQEKNVTRTIFKLPFKENETFVLNDFEIMVTERTGVGRVDGRPIAGVLGTNFFRNIYLKFDSVRQQVSFSNRGQTYSSVLGLENSGMVGDLLPFINLQFIFSNLAVSAPYIVLIDTGTDADFGIPMRFNREMPFNFLTHVRNSILEDASTFSVGYREALIISGLIFEDQPIKRPFRGTFLPFSAPTLGCGFLSRVDWCLNMAKRNFRISLDRYDRKPTSYNQLGIVIGTLGNDKHETIVEIDGGSIAEKSGLEPGYILQKVNGLFAESVPKFLEPNTTLEFSSPQSPSKSIIVVVP